VRQAPLVATKLALPPAASSYQDRARLDVRLDGALSDTIRLTLVSAPPGYGKTVAAAGWLASRAIPYAWLSLDAADNDPTRFLRYLLAALKPVRPAVRLLASTLVAGAAHLPAQDATAALIDALAARDDAFVLVLDDFHVVTSDAVHAIVRALAEHGPPFVHLVIVTREDPPLPLARLRGHGRLLEVRAEDLRFTGAELRDFFAAVGSVELDEEHAAELLRRTEGWAAGLQLAAISLRDRPDPGALVDAFAGSQRFVLDYLAAEVLERLDADLRAFLVAASVCPRFSAELCRALTGRADAGTLLERAERMNLFLIPLDLERRWYRFHHLFADYLATLLDADERRVLHERAAEWLEAQGLAPEAIEHALAARSVARATRLIERTALATYEAGELETLLRWLDALPAEAVATSPSLLGFRAAAFFFTGRLGEAARVCAESRGAEGETTGRLLAIRALLATVVGDADAAGMARSALARLSRDDTFRPLALQALGTAQVVAGDYAAAAETTREALETGLASRRPIVTLPALTMLATALNLIGRRGEAESWCRRILAEYGGVRGSMHAGLGYAAYWLGIVRYEANDLDEARRLLEMAWEAAGRSGRGRVLINTSVAYLALARLASGASDEALDAVRTLQEEMRRAGVGARGDGLAEVHARIHVLVGDLGPAARWADTLPGPSTPALAGQGGLGLAVDLTLARVRLAQDRMTDAAASLRRARAAAQASGDIADLISVAVLEAERAERSGDRRAAQRALEEAVRLATPESYLRRVIDDGQRVAHLLPAVRRLAPAFVDQVTAALAGGGTKGAPTRGAGPSLWQDARGELLEALTARELDVLRLMAAGQGDAAIAEALVVSLTTAKWHAAHVRAKLGAKTRTQALLRAQQLGLV
jgi:LuxR family maltose regulon positive regulatory protein